MYARAQTWLPTQPRGLGAINMRDLARAAARSRGLGQSCLSSISGGIAPGSQCYDSSHDPGEIHCATFSDILNPANWLKSMTTTCSQAEQDCLCSYPGLSQPTAPGLPVGYNPATGTVAPSNTTGATAPAGTTSTLTCPSGQVLTSSGLCVASSIAGPGGSGTPTPIDQCTQYVGISCNTIMWVGLAAVALIAVAQIVTGRR